MAAKKAKKATQSPPVQEDPFSVIDMTEDEVEVLDPVEKVIIDANDDPHNFPTSGDQGTASRKREALTLRMYGLTVIQIADRLKVSRQQVYAYINDALQELSTDDVRLLRNVHHQRLEQLLMVHYPGALAGDMSSTNATLAIMDRMERLFALSAVPIADPKDMTHDEEESGILLGGSEEEYVEALHKARKALGPGK